MFSHIQSFCHSFEGENWIPKLKTTLPNSSQIAKASELFEQEPGEQSGWDELNSGLTSVVYWVVVVEWRA